MGFAGDHVGVEAKEKHLADAIVRLLGNGKAELPPMRKREVRRVAERNAFAKLRASNQPRKPSRRASAVMRKGTKVFVGFFVSLRKSMW